MTQERHRAQKTDMDLSELEGATILSAENGYRPEIHFRLPDGREGHLRGRGDSFESFVEKEKGEGMEIRRLVISNPAGKRPFPSRCSKCKEGVVDATEEEAVCRECGFTNSTGVDNLRRGFTFIIRR